MRPVSPELLVTVRLDQTCLAMEVEIVSSGADLWALFLYVYP